MSTPVSHDEIRHMVRELLRDAVAGGGADANPPQETPAARVRSGDTEAPVGGLSERVRAALGSGGGGIEIAIAGDADNGAPVSNSQSFSPVSRSNTYSRPSPDPI